MKYLSKGWGTPPKWNIYPEGGGYPTSVEYLCRRGVHSNSVEYLSTWGGGTPPWWNIYPEGGVHHLSGIFIQGGGVHHLSGIFFPASHFPQCSIFPPFLGGGGAVPLCCMVSHSSQLSIFMMVFFLVGGCVAGGGSGRLFIVPFSAEGRKGGVGYHTFIRFLLRCVIFYVLDTRCQIRLQTSDFIHIADRHKD